MPVPVVVEEDGPASPDDTGTSMPAVERHATQSSAIRGVPKSKEDWDEFINKYSFGEFFSDKFPIKDTTEPPLDQFDDPPASPGIVDLSTQAGNYQHSITPSETERPPRIHQSSAMSIDAGMGTTDTAEVQTKQVLASDVSRNQSPATPSSDDNLDAPTDFHPNTSSSGPSNQDPEIPNLEVAAESSRLVNNAISPNENQGRRRNEVHISSRQKADPSLPRQTSSEEHPKADQPLTAASLAAQSSQGPARPAYERGAPEGSSDNLARAIPFDGSKIPRRGSKGSRASKDRVSLKKKVTAGRPDALAGTSETDDPEEVARALASAKARRLRRTQSGDSKGSRKSKSSNGSNARGGNLTSHAGRRDVGNSQDITYAESVSTTSASATSAEAPFDFDGERDRLRKFYAEFGYLPAPQQPPDQVRRRLRAIRRLGLGDPEDIHRETLDRFTRLAASIFKCSMSAVTVVGKDYTLFPSETGFGRSSFELDLTLCSHSILSPGSGEECMVIPNASKDWRFANNPVVNGVQGNIQFYAGSPLRIGVGNKTTVIGTLCILDDKPREFGKHGKAVLQDLAECVVSELELLYNQQATLESAKLHQISVDFLRRSLQVRPAGRPGQGMSRGNKTGSSSSISGERREKADSSISEENVDIYDEACREIRLALDAYAVTIVDLSQFHLFYPAYQSSSMANSSTQRGSSIRSANTAGGSGSRSFASSNAQTESYRKGAPKSWTAGSGGASAGAHGSGGSSGGSAIGGFGETMTAGPWGRYRESGEEEESYGKPDNPKVARQTFSITDATTPSRTPQVLFVPHRRRVDPKRSRYTSTPEEQSQDDVGPSPFTALIFIRVDPKDFAYLSKQLAVLGYSCEFDNFVFNFTSSPAARKIISEFIANNVKTRRVWYARDDGEGIAQSITHLMPPGTETSMAMPVFGFDGQVAFAVVACWTDPLYTYPAGAMQFVETIAGSLLASVMKERLHHVERAQLSFAAAASHELRTPLHQLNAAASMLRHTLGAALTTPSSSPPLEREDLSRLSMSSQSHMEGSTHSQGSSLSLGEQPSDQLDRRASASRAGLDSETRREAISQLEIIESNGSSLGTILENIIDTLDIGRGAAARLDEKFMTNPGTGQKADRQTTSFSDTLEDILNETLRTEAKARRVAGANSLDEVEIILEVIPRSRGGWLMTDDAGPLSRALGKIINNAVKFTDQGYIHITVQDVSREAVLPAGYDNSIKMSTVSIDIKDSGCGMSAEFLEREVLEPFTKADPFMPGSGLGLGLAQRMVEILGGKLAIASTLGQGTLVHVEVPLHLLSGDHDSDQEDLRVEADDGDVPSSNPTRQDGIYLAGFGGASHAGVRRVGKCLLRQLKHNMCRVVAEIQYASLIVAPVGSLSSESLVTLHQRARPHAQVILLDQPRINKRPTSTTRWPRNTEAECGAADYLGGLQITILHRPLTPSLVKLVMEPPPAPPVAREVYKSEVVGGSHEEGEGSTTGLARSVHGLSLSERGRLESSGGHTLDPGSRRSSLSDVGARPGIGARGNSYAVINPSPIYERENFDTDIESPDLGPPVPLPSSSENSLLSSEDTSSSDYVTKTSFLPSLASRPFLGHQQVTDPLPVVGSQGRVSGDDQTSLTVGGDPSSSKDAIRPKLRDVRSTPVTAVTSDPTAGLSSTAAVVTDSGSSYKVLVVEDNAVNRKILTTMLRRAATKYAEAVDGFDAVEKFLVFAPDLVLLDINMPRKDGFEAAAEMREIERTHKRSRSKIIAVTAMSSEKQKRRGMIECGIDEWKTKPVSIKDLKKDVEALKISGI